MTDLLNVELLSIDGRTYRALYSPHGGYRAQSQHRQRRGGYEADAVDDEEWAGVQGGAQGGARGTAGWDGGGGSDDGEEGDTSVDILQEGESFVGRLRLDAEVSVRVWGAERFPFWRRGVGGMSEQEGGSTTPFSRWRPLGACVCTSATVRWGERWVPGADLWVLVDPLEPQESTRCLAGRSLSAWPRPCCLGLLCFAGFYMRSDHSADGVGGSAPHALGAGTTCLSIAALHPCPSLPCSSSPT